MCSVLREATRVIAYGGMDSEIKESGMWKGKAKLSKRGSGLLRRMLYMAALRSIHEARLSLWSLLSAPGGAWSKVWLGPDSCHAQNVGSGHLLTQA